MTDDELLKEFTDVQHRPNGIAIRVCRITWPSPHEPRSRWRTVVVLPADSSMDDVAKARRKLLENLRYFRVCKECRERKPDGWMHGDAICQACAEKNHGVVY